MNDIPLHGEQGLATVLLPTTMETLHFRPYLLNLRSLFYMVTPNETTYERLEDVPDYVQEAIPFCTVLILLECVVLKLQGKDVPRINDSINSLSHGLLASMHSLLFRSLEMIIYVWLYNNYHIIELPWNSAWTWLLAFLTVDFLYYWFHRASHEINIIWAAHQVHHSSEEYNLTTSLRQSFLQQYFSMFFYFPMALCVPPPVAYVHFQFTLLYQFWIHTKVVDNIGPLEYILNTPRHHRVHHGRNRYCIDVNYGGTLIIWDRIFNTFSSEQEEIVYGLVHPNQFWAPVYSQLYHYKNIYDRVKNDDGLEKKICAVIKGPSWYPGGPWTGCRDDRPTIEYPIKKYNSDIPMWANLYVVLHFGLVLAGYSAVASYKEELTVTLSLGFIFFLTYSLTVFGALFDNRKCSSLMELLRCSLFLLFGYYMRGPQMFQLSLISIVDVIFLLSAILWGILTLIQYDIRVVAKKSE